ncbi:unnamed protein product [Clonostachys rhizophaga]|uniref:Uncharacterized protein n=1 Tax=Clonostachys rhizophaga TaxID=160324 RepID=A0A9N9VSI1_9HYPO|nr:unnamed protein product [Clonostachys rhizophaga]
MPVMCGTSNSDFEALKLPLGARLAEALIAVIAIGLVTLVYTLLIQRGALMATTCVYPQRPIEANISHLLNAAWPSSSEEVGTSWESNQSAPKGQGNSIIQLFYIGKMKDDSRDGFVAKGRQQSIAEPSGSQNRRSVWLTSGSPLTRNVVQIMVWEWASLWLMIIMSVALLLFNGFFTSNVNLDSYPRLTITLIYSAAFMAHFSFVWIASLEFFGLVFAGASWSLLEKSKFVIAETHKLQSHSVGTPFKFRSIDKANEAYVPMTFAARLGNPTPQSPTLALSSSTMADVAKGQNLELGEGAAELSVTLETINSIQKAEREYSTEASRQSLDRVMANAMMMMAVTLVNGFASWTSSQFTENSPNNTTTTQIGSLALLASLSLGATTMFSSAMQLNIMKSSFRTILSLKEMKINGLALDLHRKTRTRTASSWHIDHPKAVAFTESNGIAIADVKIADFFAANRSFGYTGLIGIVLLGPGYAMLPRFSDYHRKSAEVEFDFEAPIDGGKVVLTTRETDRHAKREGNGNLDPVVVCYMPDESFGKEPC